MKLLDENNYTPSGWTALYDAILKAICLLTPVIYKAYEEGLYVGTRVCILTDGLDEGPLGLGTGSEISPARLRKVVDFMTENRVINRIILAGLGSYDYKVVGHEVGIQEVIEVERDEKGIRRAFELFSSVSQ